MCVYLATKVAKDHSQTLMMLWKKQAELQALESAMSPELIHRLKAIYSLHDGSQYRPKAVESPSRQKVLAKLQAAEEEVYQTMGCRYRSSKMAYCVGINAGLDVESHL